jgi:hypothetical protein
MSCASRSHADDNREGQHGAERRDSSRRHPPVHRARYRHKRIVMRRVRVESSSIAAVGYDAGEVTLEVEFVTGRVYRYFGVPAYLHDAFLTAPSKGQFFNTFIRDRYVYEEIDRGASG